MGLEHAATLGTARTRTYHELSPPVATSFCTPGAPAAQGWYGVVWGVSSMEYGLASSLHTSVHLLRAHQLLDPKEGLDHEHEGAQGPELLRLQSSKGQQWHI